MHFLSIGECMAELAPLDPPGDFRLGFAGDTFNTAWYLRQLRTNIVVSYLSAVGCDGISDRMLHFIESAGIGTQHIARHPERSVGLYMITLSDGERSFTYWRDRSAARLLTGDETAFNRAVEGADLIYFSGITMAILSDAARERLLLVLESARSDGRTIAFDPNLRPRLWPDTDRMTTAIMRGAAVSDIVLPSYEDEAAYFGDANPHATAERYKDAGANGVIVKSGAEPVFFIHEGERGEVPVEPVTRIIDTTSAGDSFNAGYFAGLDAGKAIASRIELGAKVAGQVIGGKGALVPLDHAFLTACPERPGAGEMARKRV